jgi:hypothetical protein
MKTTIQTLSKGILLFVLAMSVFSCSRSSDATPAATVSYVSMKINGVLWKSSIGLGGISSGNYSATGTLDVSGVKDVLVIGLPGAATTGTYNMLNFSNIPFGFSKGNGSFAYNIGKDYKGSSGTLTITQLGTTVGAITYANATFSGTAIGSDKAVYTITEGVIVNAQVN